MREAYSGGGRPWFAVLLGVLVVAGLFLQPVRGGQDAPKMVVAVAPDDALEVAALGWPGIELAGPFFDTWPVLIVTQEGLRRLTMSGTSYLMLEADLTRNLRSLDSDMGDYHTYDETSAELARLESEYPGLVEVRSIGQSIQGREILAAVVSGADGADAVWGTCLLVGMHHGREIISTEIVLYALNYLLEQYGTDTEITYLLNHRRVIFVPMLNPDGHVRVEGGWDWRKNMRDNGDGTLGVDLNRNYSYQWGYDDTGSSARTSSETYRGASPFSEPETQALRSLRDAEHYNVSLSFHSFGNVIFYPWSYCDEFSPDHALQSRFASVISAESGYSYGNTGILEFYPANGEFDDWNYAGLGLDQKVFGLTFEVGDTYYEPEQRIQELCEQNIECCVQAIRASGPWLTIEQFKIAEEQPDGTIRAGERFTIELLVQSLSLTELGPVTVSCTTDSPLISIIEPIILLESTEPLARLASGECSFEAIALFGEDLPQVVPLRIDIETEAFNRQIELMAPVGIEMSESIIAWDFEEDAGFDVRGQWQRGAPDGGGGNRNGGPGPDEAYSGERVYATVMNGDVSGPEERYFLTSPAFSCEGFSCTRLSFQRWMNVGAWDHYRVSVSVLAGGRWHGVWLSLEETTDSEWQAVSLDISRWADDCDEVRVRFSLVANSAEAYSGLYLDDLAVTGCRLSTSSDLQRIIIPLVFSTSDGMVDTIVIAQNKSEEPKLVQLQFKRQDGTRHTFSAVVGPGGFLTVSASAEASEGLSRATLYSQNVGAFNVSAFLVDLNSSSVFSIDTIREDVRSINLHVYYVDGDSGAESFLLLSNNSTEQGIMNVDVVATDAGGNHIGSVEESLLTGAMELIPLGGVFGPGLGVLSVRSDVAGLGACGLITLGARLQIMKAFCGN